MSDLITQIILAVAGVLTPVVAVYVANLVKKYIPNRGLLQALQQFSKDAVVIAEKAGVSDKALIKKQYAIDKLNDMLVQAGFSAQDKELLSACIEHAYCVLKDDIESVYQDKGKTETNAVTVKEKSQEKVYKLSEITDKNGNILPELMKGANK